MVEVDKRSVQLHIVACCGWGLAEFDASTEMIELGLKRRP
jgi:hypothetical protein